MNYLHFLIIFALVSCAQIKPIQEVEVHQEDNKELEALFAVDLPEGVTPIRSFQVEKKKSFERR